MYQLFADDGTLYAIGDRACREIIEGCMQWAEKHNMVLNMSKSKALSMQGHERPLYDDEEHFEMVRNAVLLGVGINGKGVYSTAYLRTL